MLGKYVVEAWDEADYNLNQLVSHLSAIAFLVNQTALILHIVDDCIVWRRTEIKGAQTAIGTLRWWGKCPFTVVTSRERKVQFSGWYAKAVVAYHDHCSSPALSTCSSFIWCYTKCICYRWTARRIADNVSAVQQAVLSTGRGSTLCACPYFSYPELLNRMKFDMSVCSVSFANFVSGFYGNVSVFAKAAPCSKVRKLGLRK